MSVKIMGLVWDLKITQAEKLVLLAYADHADHKGFSIFPAVSTIAEKTGYSERSVQRITKLLVENGYLIEDGQGPKGTNKWRIPYLGGAKITPLQVGGDKEGTKGVTNATQRGDTAMTPESSLTIINHQEDSSKEKKGDMMDGILHFAKEGEKVKKVEDAIEETIVRLEKGLCRNIPRTPEWQSLARWINKQDNIDQWIHWYMADEFNASTSWRLTPDKIKASWPQAPKKVEFVPVQKPEEPEPKYVPAPGMDKYEEKK